jgi:hypothetical protein
MQEKISDPPSQISPAEAFALLLETACENFEILQDLVQGQLQVVTPEESKNTPVTKEDRQKAFRAARAPARVQMALAKSFVFNAHRANRVCKLNKAALGLNRRERTRFFKATDPLDAVRDVNEHGFDGNGSVTPSLHAHEGGMLDETSLVIDGPEKVLMGPLYLYEAYLAVDRMRKLAGFGALHEKRKKGGATHAESETKAGQ